VSARLPGLHFADLDVPVTTALIARARRAHGGDCAVS